MFRLSLRNSSVVFLLVFSLIILSFTVLPQDQLIHHNSSMSCNFSQSCSGYCTKYLNNLHKETRFTEILLFRLSAAKERAQISLAQFKLLIFISFCIVVSFTVPYREQIRSNLHSSPVTLSSVFREYKVTQSPHH